METAATQTEQNAARRTKELAYLASAKSKSLPTYAHTLWTLRATKAASK